MKEFLQFDKEDFFALIEEIVARLREQDKEKQRRWIDGAEAMRVLNIKGKSTLQRLRDQGKIRFSQMERIILYDRQSLIDYIEKNARDPF